MIMKVKLRFFFSLKGDEGSNKFYPTFNKIDQIILWTVTNAMRNSILSIRE